MKYVMLIVLFVTWFALGIGFYINGIVSAVKPLPSLAPDKTDMILWLIAGAFIYKIIDKESDNH